MTTIRYAQPAPTLDDVWRLFEETSAQMKETDRKFQETDHKIQETERMLQEAIQQMRESKREVDQVLKETAKQMREGDREVDRQMQETDKKLKKLERLFNDQWGKLVEALVEGAVVRVFNERGIAVQHTSMRNKGNYQGRAWEVDIVAKNGDIVLIIEVKTTLRPDDVKDFLEKLPHIKTWMREHANNTVYGAMAYLSANAGAEKMAQNKGLFVIRAAGDSAYLENPPEFVARVY